MASFKALAYTLLGVLSIKISMVFNIPDLNKSTEIVNCVKNVTLFNKLYDKQVILADISLTLHSHLALHIQQDYLVQIAKSKGLVVFNKLKCETSNSQRKISIDYYFMLIEFEACDKISIKTLIKQWKLCNLWNPFGEIVIIIENERNKQLFFCLKKIVKEIMIENYFVNVNVLSYSNDSTTIVNNIFNFSRKCGTQSVEYLENIYKCESGLNESTLRLVNSANRTVMVTQNRCELRVIAFVWEPFVYQPDFYKKGLDIMLAQNLADTLGLKIHFSYVNHLFNVKRDHGMLLNR